MNKISEWLAHFYMSESKVNANKRIISFNYENVEKYNELKESVKITERFVPWVEGKYINPREFKLNEDIINKYIIDSNTTKSRIENGSYYIKSYPDNDRGVVTHMYVNPSEAIGKILNITTKGIEVKLNKDIYLFLLNSKVLYDLRACPMFFHYMDELMFLGNIYLAYKNKDEDDYRFL